MRSGNDLSSRAVSRWVLSAWESLTSVFGMGTGGSFLPLSPLWLYQNTSFPYCSVPVHFATFAANRTTVGITYSNIQSVNPLPVPYLLFSPSISRRVADFFCFSIFFSEDWQLHSKYLVRFGYFLFLSKRPFQSAFAFFSRSVKNHRFLFRKRFVSYSID